MRNQRNAQRARTMRRSGLTKLDVAVTIVVLGVLAVLGVVLLPARGPSRSINCLNQLRQLGLACQMYSTKTKHRNGTPAGIITAKHQSGLVALRPYLETGGLFLFYDAYRSADENGDFVSENTYPVFSCPSDNPQGTWQSPGGGTYAQSNYVMNFGSGTLDPGDAKTDGGSTLHGPFLLNKTKGPKVAPDGSHMTVFFSEIIAGGRDEKQPDGAWGYGDAGTAAYTHLYAPNARISTVLGGDNNWAQAQATASSRHPGGVNVVFGVTNAHFLTDDIDARVWSAIGTTDGREYFFAE